MSPDDPRHGTSAGYVAGCREACCRTAIADWMRHYRTRQYLSGDLTVDGTGTRRRVRALMAAGWSTVQIDARVGKRRTYTANLLLATGPIRRTTADLYRQAFESMCHESPPTTTRYERQRVTRLRNQAARDKWPTADQWLDIDDPDEIPDPGYGNDVDDDLEPDPVVVERILAGFKCPEATRPEQAEVLRRWTGTVEELERITGWNVMRLKRSLREARCGTDPGYYRHRRNGETACGPCKAAHTSSEGQRAQKARERARVVA